MGEKMQNNGNGHLRFWLPLLCSTYGFSLDWCIDPLGTCKIFFDSTPFHGKNEIQILHLVTKGKRPGRLASPRMEDDTWDLIQKCWEPIPSKRSTIKDIATALARPA